MYTEEEEAKPQSRVKRIVVFVLKLIFTVGAFALVFSKIDTAHMLEQMQQVTVIGLVLSFLVLNISQVISALRMRYYFSTAGYFFRRKFCLAIYYSGALLNLVLPGGISGDGFKAIFLKRSYKIPMLRSLRLMVSERANGLFFLGMFAFLFLGLSDIAAEFSPLSYIEIVIGAVLFTLIYFCSVKLVLKENLKSALGACRFSLFSQSAVVISGFIIIREIVGPDHALEYLAIFMVANLASIIPVSVGGAGMRELTFYFAAPYLLIDAEKGVAISLLFFGIHALVSLVGAYFINKLNVVAEDGLLRVEREGMKP